MPHFSFTVDMQAFRDIELIVDYRISGTYTDLDNWVFDSVEVPARGHGWREITRLHALHRAVDAYLDTQDAADQVRACIRADMAEEGRRRRTVPVVAWIGDTQPAEAPHAA